MQVRAFARVLVCLYVCWKAGCLAALRLTNSQKRLQLPDVHVFLLYSRILHENMSSSPGHNLRHCLRGMKRGTSTAHSRMLPHECACEAHFNTKETASYQYQCFLLKEVFELQLP